MVNSSKIALHGFLGTAADWQPFGFEGLDLSSINPMQSMGTVAKQLNDHYSDLKAPRVLIGYSLGGRLALHLLKERPDLWQAAILISANPGLKGEEQRHERRQQDEAWAQRFENEKWEMLMADWNSQPVFGGVPSPFERKAAHFDRQWLASVLRHWSLGAQEDFQVDIAQFDMPILWVAGERDERFAKVATSFPLKHPSSKIWIAPNAAHRVPWEAKEEFIAITNNFLGELGL